MKFLLDQNLSRRLVAPLQKNYPGTTHLQEFELDQASDEQVWEFALTGNFIILSKDADFHQMSFLCGHPPKVVWISLGNCSTDELLNTIQTSAIPLALFNDDPDASFLRLS